MSQEAWVLEKDGRLFWRTASRDKYLCACRYHVRCVPPYPGKPIPMQGDLIDLLQKAGYTFIGVGEIPEGCKVCREVKGVAVKGQQYHHPEGTYWEPL